MWWKCWISQNKIKKHTHIRVDANCVLTLHCDQCVQNGLMLQHKILYSSLNRLNYGPLVLLMERFVP